MGGFWACMHQGINTDTIVETELLSTTSKNLQHNFNYS